MGEKLRFKEVRTHPAPFTFRYSQWRSWDSHPSMSRSRAHAFPSMARGLPRWLSPKLDLALTTDYLEVSVSGAASFSSAALIPF